MKKIGIGYDNYRKFIDQNLYYVDKTLLVRDVLEKGMGDRMSFYIRENPSILLTYSR